MFIDQQALMAEKSNTYRIPMVAHDREVLYSHNYAAGEWTDGPKITRYTPGPNRPASRQFVFGSASFSMWQSMHGTHTRANPLDRTNLNRAMAKPIRLWDRSSYPQSVPPSTYYANPSQQMTGAHDTSGYQLPLTAQVY